uniref:Uncharacterized protein n=1 Tax=Plectus sambesii TaxID=2011161 RepID=A0A914VUE0_9BILA
MAATPTQGGRQSRSSVPIFIADQLNYSPTPKPVSAQSSPAPVKSSARINASQSVLGPSPILTSNHSFAAAVTFASPPSPRQIHRRRPPPSSTAPATSANKPRAPYAAALQDLANCNQQAYADECGAQVGEEICEFSGLMVKNFMPETQSCSVQCSTQQTSMMRRILPNYVIEENVNIVDVEEAMENDCDPTKFRQCAGAFKKGLGLHGKGVRSVIAGLKSIVDKEGKQGFQRICSAGAQFGKCGGGECTTIESLVTKLNMSKADAVMLNVTVFSLTYECSHPVFTQNFDCLVQTEKAKKHVIKRCEKRFIKEMKLHPGIPCKAAQQLMECTVSPFKRACGAPAAEGLCEFEKKYIETYLPHVKGCPLHCNV